ncbi:MAG: hypothetical protein QXO71_05825 [Candidatus Jordarchaeaceae archaeon]
MTKRTGITLLSLMLLTLITGLAVLITTNNYSSYPPLIPTTNTIINQKNTTTTFTDNLTNSLVLRSISINNYGIATISDTITVRNDGVNSATFADVLYPEDIYPKLLTYTAQSGKIPLSTEKISSNGHNGIRIIFHKSVAPGETYTFELVQYFDETITTVTVSPIANMSQFDFLTCPYSPYKTEICNVSVSLPRGAKSYYSPLTYSVTNVAPFNSNNTISIMFSFSDGESIISLVTVYRRITVDPWLGITVTELNIIENKGSSNLEKIHFPVYPGTIKFAAYDAAGQIFAYPSVDGIIVNPRFPVPPNGTYIYYVVYTVPIIVAQLGSSGSYLFAFNILPNYGGVIKNFYVSLIFTNFVKLSFWSPPTIPISSTANNVFLYAWNNVIPTQSAFFYVVYCVGLPTTYIRPLILMFIFGSIATAYVLIRTRRVEAAPPIVTPEKVLAPILSEFCELYDQKNALILEMDSLREDALRGKIKKFEYAQRVKSAEKELATLNKQIEEKKNEILKLNKKFESDFKYLEVNEADRDQAKLTLQHLKRRYMLKRLSKETYLELTEAQEKKLKKAESNIEKKIQDLRREAA